MNILGICDSQDSGAVLSCGNGSRIFALNEERLSRLKLQGGFPELSVREVLKQAGLTPDKIDLVAIASHMTPCFGLRAFPRFHQQTKKRHGQFSFLLSVYMLYHVVARKLVFPMRLESFLSRIVIRNRLKKIGFPSCRLITVDHHQAHAQAAFCASGFNSALVITIDGLGDGVSFTVSVGKGKKLQTILAQQAFNDITLYYSRLTEFLGFKPIQDEGKVMGLAGYSAQRGFLSQARKLLRCKDGRFRGRNLFFSFSRDKNIFRELAGKNKREISASFQFHLEQVVVEIIKYWIKKTGISDVALGGGFFANIKVNQKIAELDEVSNVFIYPHMGDGGLALGAVCAVNNGLRLAFKNAFLGISFADEDIRTILDERKLIYEYDANIEQRLAVLLSQGKIIGRFEGAMEYGPRALGNRSILAEARDPQITNSLNQKLGRDDFMPFAPAVLFEDRNKCCFGAEKAFLTAMFMNISFSCTEYFQKTCPAVVHKDGTTRAQFVDRSTNESFWMILEKYKKITGIPALINTSFNFHEEPIVCSPEDAIRTFQKSRLDYLAIGNFLIRGGDDGKEEN